MKKKENLCFKLSSIIKEKKDELNIWYEEKIKDLPIPLYSSFDIRDSGEKIAPVDANIFPAGFNNICSNDFEFSIQLMKKALVKRGISQDQKIGIIPEYHEKNPFYWTNALAIKNLIEESGYKSTFVLPKQTVELQKRVDSIGKEISIARTEDALKECDVFISNCDFSEGVPDFLEAENKEVFPHPLLGWHNREKYTFFKYYNQMIKEFSDILGISSEQLDIKTFEFRDFDLSDEKSLARLSSEIDKLIGDLNSNATTCCENSVFVKNSKGTYGLGVTQVKAGEEVLAWNYKTRKKMKASKGGAKVSSLILQEAIPTSLSEAGASAETAIYMIDQCLSGGFLRVHAAKGPRESLNSPGAVYRKLCLSDLEVHSEGMVFENVYGWISKVGVLALGLEAQEIVLG